MVKDSGWLHAARRPATGGKVQADCPGNQSDICAVLSTLLYLTLTYAFYHRNFGHPYAREAELLAHAFHGDIFCHLGLNSCRDDRHEQLVSGKPARFYFSRV